MRKKQRQEITSVSPAGLQKKKWSGWCKNLQGWIFWLIKLIYVVRLNPGWLLCPQSQSKKFHPDPFHQPDHFLDLYEIFWYFVSRPLPGFSRTIHFVSRALPDYFFLPAGPTEYSRDAISISRSIISASRTIIADGRTISGHYFWSNTKIDVKFLCDRPYYRMFASNLLLYTWFIFNDTVEFICNIANCDIFLDLINSC